MMPIKGKGDKRCGMIDAANNKWLPDQNGCLMRLYRESGGTDVDVDGVGESDALLLVEDDYSFFVGGSLDCCMNVSIICIHSICCNSTATQ